MKKYPLNCCVAFFLSISVFSYAVPPPPPANDNPCSAKDLGILPNPGLCGLLGFQVTEIGDNTNATPEPIQPSLLNCSGIALLDMPTQSKDLWYSFVATGNTLHTNLAAHGNGAAIQKYVIALYEYRGNCTLLIPVDCDKTVSPLYKLSSFFRGIVPGTTYYLQVSGKDLTDVGEFSLDLKNIDDCGECMQTSQLFMNPPPVLGYYEPGTNVHFRYIVRGYNNNNTQNTLHGVVPSMGPAWGPIGGQLGSATASGTGDWTWYNLYQDNNNIYYTGFFYETNVNIHDPKDNKGDPGGANSTWIFEWDASTIACVGNPALEDLSIRIDHYSEHITGDLSGNAVCDNDPHFSFKSTMRCCIAGQKPVLATTNDNCQNGCSGSLTVSGATGGHVTIVDDHGNQLLDVNPVIQAPQLTSLCLGNYTVLTDYLGCLYADLAHVGGDMFDLAVSQTGYGCIPLAQNSATVYTVPAGQTFSYLWDNGETTNPAIALSPGTHSVTVTDQNSCSHSITVDIKGIPPDDATFSYPMNDVFCTKDMNTIFPDYVGDQNGNFQFAAGNPPPGLQLNPSTGAITITNPPVPAGIYAVVHTTYGPCSSSYTQNITFVNSFDASFSYKTHNFCQSVLWDTIPDIIADSTGYFYTSPNTLVIDSFTGRVNGGISPVGSYTIYHVVGGYSLCADTASFTITNFAAPATPANATFSYCVGDHIDSLFVPSSLPELTAWFHILDLQGIPDVYGVNYYDPVPYMNGGSPIAGTYSFYAARFNVLTSCYSYLGFMNITINNTPTVNAGGDQTVCPGIKFDLITSGNDPNSTYLWSPAKLVGDSTSLSTYATIDSTTNFILKITDPNGCVSYDSVTIAVKTGGCGDSLKFYNGFSPNGDGKNDIWEIDGIKNSDENSVHIFNRWGTLVWEAHNYDNDKTAWKGQDQSNADLPAGTYYFLIYTTKDSVTNHQSGWVELTR